MSNPTAVLFHTDAYKLGHVQQYPEGTEFVFSNYTNRSSRIDGVNYVVNFGLQAFLQEWAIDGWKDFFAADEDEVAEEYERKVANILGPNSIGSEHIRALHRLGYLPLEFRQLPEGTLVPIRVPSFTIENTLPEFYWLVNYIETVVSNSVWQAQTSATQAYRLRHLLDYWANKTGDPEFVNWQGHDFSFRGLSSLQSAHYSGAGHLLSFTGTDTLAAIDWVEEFYPGDNGLIGGSVPATEHSVMCAGGKEEERETFNRLLQIYPTGIVSVVSDTWDLWNVLTKILPDLHDEILARDGKLVIRPDSGDPVDILTGTLKFPQDKLRWPDTPNDPDGRTAAEKGVIELLWDTFGGSINEKGYRVLDPHVGAIYGDSITYDRAQAIAQRLEAKGFASTNVVYGVGSYTYQYVTRDTFGSAIKATWVQVNGEERQIFKDPVTDSGLKKSARGRLVVKKDDIGLSLLDGLSKREQSRLIETGDDQMKTIWRDGEFIYKESFADIRARLTSQEVL